MTCSMSGDRSNSSRTVVDGHPGRLVEREAADARAECRERDARGVDLPGPGHRAADGRLDGRAARPAVPIEGDGMDDRPGGQGSGGGHDGFAERDGRLADGRELDLVTAGALDGPADPGRHPQRQVRRVDDRVDLEVADIAVPEFDPCQVVPLPSLDERPQTDRAGRGMVHPGQPASHLGHDLPRVRGAWPRQVLHADPLVALACRGARTHRRS